MALKRRRLRVFRLLLSQATVHTGSDRLGTIDLPWRSSGGVLGFSAVALTGYGALRLRSIGDNRSTMALKRRRLRVFRLLLSQATVHSGSDRLGTIDLPWRSSGGVLAVFLKSHRIQILESDAKKTMIS
jgi:hypothetical protein